MARTRIDMGIGWCEKEKMQGRRGVSMRTPLTTAIAFLVAFVIGVTPAAAGTLKVTSFPSGAQVIVDGVNTGKVTPMNISVADGDHIVTVQIPGSGWNPDTRTVTIGPGNNDLSVTLLPMLRRAFPSSHR
jgi:PEGA domain